MHELETERLAQPPRTDSPLYGTTSNRGKNKRNYKKASWKVKIC